MTQDLRRKRLRLAEQMRALHTTATTETRALTGEEQQTFDRLWTESEQLRSTIEQSERLESLERELGESQGTAAGRENRSAQGAGERATNDPRATEEYRSAYRSWMRNGMAELGTDERRALSATTASSGGFLVAPQQMVSELILFVKNLVFIRQKATVFPVPTAASLGAASLDADPADGDWTSEIATGSEDSNMAFGKRELVPHPLAKRIKVSNKLLRNAGIDVEALVRDRLGYKFAIPEEKGFLLGTGVNQPLGLFTASANGISTARDINTSNTTTAMTYLGLVAAKYALKQQYRAKASWMFHRDGVKQIASLVDGQSRPLWQPSVVVGQPDTILGLPFTESEYVPNTFTTGKYVGILGDYSFYWIADALDLQIQRLVELYAETNQTGFIGRKETDGMPVLEEAFVRVTLG